MKNNQMSKTVAKVISTIEHFLAIITLAGITLFVAIYLVNFDISSLNNSSTLVNVISNVLLLILGLEVVRLLAAPSVRATLELLIYVIARKSLSPQATSLDLLYNSISFAIILMIIYFFLSDDAEKRLNFFQFMKSRNNKN